MKEGVKKKDIFFLKYLKTKSKRRSHSNPRLSRSWSRSNFFEFWGPWGSLGVPGGSLGGPWGVPGGSLGGPWDFPCRSNKIQIQTAISPKYNGARTHSHGRVANTCLLCLSRSTTNDAQPSLKLFFSLKAHPCLIHAFVLRMGLAVFCVFKACGLCI